MTKHGGGGQPIYAGAIKVPGSLTLVHIKLMFGSKYYIFKEYSVASTFGRLQSEPNFYFIIIFFFFNKALMLFKKKKNYLDGIKIHLSISFL